jgi:hypothetical protein
MNTAERRDKDRGGQDVHGETQIERHRKIRERGGDTKLQKHKRTQSRDTEERHS